MVAIDSGNTKSEVPSELIFKTMASKYEYLSDRSDSLWHEITRMEKSVLDDKFKAGDLSCSLLEIERFFNSHGKVIEDYKTKYSN